MATQEDIYRFVNEVVGTRDVEHLTQDIKDQRAELLKLKTEFDAGGLSEQAFTAKAGACADSLKALNAQLAAAEKAAGKASSGLAGSSQSLLQTGRVVQDFTSGFKATGLAGGIGAVTNNVEGLVQSLGGPAGLAGVLTIVAVGGQLLMPVLKSLYEEFTRDAGKADAYARSLGGMKEKLKELTDEKFRVAIDQDAVRLLGEAIKKTEEGIAALKAASAQSSDAEKEAGGNVSDLLNNAPGGRAALNDEMTKAEVRRLTAGSGDYQEQMGIIARAKATLADANTKAAERARAENRIAEALKTLHDPDTGILRGIVDQAKANLGNANREAEKGKRDAIDTLARAARAAGRNDVAEGLAQAPHRPSKAADEKAAAEYDEFQRKERKEAPKRAEKARKDAEELAKAQAELNQGEKDDAAKLAEKELKKREKGLAAEVPDGGFEDVETTAAERGRQAKQWKDLDDQLEKERREGDKKDREAAAKKVPADITAQVEAYTLQNRQAQREGGGLSDAAFNQQIRRMVAQELVRRGATDDDGNRLGRDRAGGVADQVVVDSQEKLSDQLTQAMGQVGDVQQAEALILSNLIASVEGMQQKLAGRQAGARPGAQAAAPRRKAKGGFRSVAPSGPGEEDGDDAPGAGAPAGGGGAAVIPAMEGLQAVQKAEATVLGNAAGAIRDMRAEIDATLAQLRRANDQLVQNSRTGLRRGS